MSTDVVASLRLEGLSRGGVAVLGPLALRLHRGETLALVGPSGIGKTSLLRVLAGLDGEYSGHVQRPDRVAMVFQEPTLLPWRRLVENLTLTTGIGRTDAARWLEAVGLGGRGSDFPGQLSLGQQRRLALARAFATRPDLLLMDEPFVSLDPETAASVTALYTELRAQHGVTTVLVTHVAEEAERLATRIVELGGAPGRITGERQKIGAYFHSSASGVTSAGS